MTMRYARGAGRDGNETERREPRAGENNELKKLIFLLMNEARRARMVGPGTGTRACPELWPADGRWPNAWQTRRRSCRISAIVNVPSRGHHLHRRASLLKH